MTIDKVKEARQVWNGKVPWLTYPTMRLQLVECRDIPTCATDGKRLLYNPDWLFALPLDERVFCVGHEVGHNILMHPFRRCGRRQDVWNIAGDFVINALLVEMGLPVPKGCLHDEKYKGWTTEAVYDDLMQQIEQNGGKGKGKGKGPDGLPKDSHCSGCKDYGEGDQGVTSADVAEAVREAQEAAQAAVKLAKAMGKLPGSLARMVGENAESAVPWQEQIRRWARDVSRGHDDTTWASPSRRGLSMDMYLPDSEGIQIDLMASVIDVSGSITDELLKQYGGELDSLMKECGIERAVVLYGDTEVQKVEWYDNGMDVKLSSVGGGGTDFRPMFEEIEKMNLRPRFMIFFTDTYGCFPDNPPPYPVLWAVVGSDGSVPWGEVVRIPR